MSLKQYMAIGGAIALTLSILGAIGFGFDLRPALASKLEEHVAEFYEVRALLNCQGCIRSCQRGGGTYEKCRAVCEEEGYCR